MKNTSSSQDFDANLTAYSKKVELKVNHRLFNIQNAFIRPEAMVHICIHNWPLQA